MSSNLIRNEDYTAPDLFQKFQISSLHNLYPSQNKIPSDVHSNTSNRAVIFSQKKSLYSSGSVSSEKVINHHHQHHQPQLHNSNQLHYPHHHQHPHNPNNNLHTTITTTKQQENGLGQLKIIRANSLLLPREQQDMKNFKMFYDVLVKGMYEKDQCQSLWRKFQAFSDNSYELEHFLWQFGKKKQNQLYLAKIRQEENLQLLKNKLKIQIKQQQAKKSLQYLEEQQQPQPQPNRPKKPYRSKSLQISAKIFQYDNNSDITESKQIAQNESKFQSPQKLFQSPQRQIQSPNRVQKQVKFNKINLNPNGYSNGNNINNFNSPKNANNINININTNSNPTQNSNSTQNKKKPTKLPKRHKSLQKLTPTNLKDIKFSLRKQFAYVRKIIQHGEKFIHS